MMRETRECIDVVLEDALRVLPHDTRPKEEASKNIKLQLNLLQDDNLHAHRMTLCIRDISSSAAYNLACGLCASSICFSMEVFAQKHELPLVGQKPVAWLEDGDKLTMEAWFTTQSGARAGFGGLKSLVLPAKTSW